jgi:hypothetical protein
MGRGITLKNLCGEVLRRRSEKTSFFLGYGGGQDPLQKDRRQKGQS